ncbi:MAG: Glutamyl-tRNA(Gln) amidotransferase subunit A [Owenweeksia sp. TMED14]|nr:MAG: Glutamyl-tRNA(Gln) amidotransferase subunit A [Owenweeksia sp. TMED14]
MKRLNLNELQSAIISGKTSCVQEVELSITKANEKSELNIFIEIFLDSAISKAKEVDAKFAAGTSGRLAGMIIGIKDNLCYKGHKVSASSKMLKDFESQFNSTVVQKLLDADAIILGRTGGDEFAMGSSSETSFYGPVKNPLNPLMSPGGSSGGSAAAVSSGICHAAIGSDTGGSIRQPAAFCGIYGVKPSYGRVSRHGVIAYASSFDQVGPLANSIEDLALITEVISGGDDFDTTCSKVAVPKMSYREKETKPLKLGYYKSMLDSPALDPEIREKFFETLSSLRTAGHNIKILEFPFFDVLIPIYYILTTAEASSNLARYDGIHVGHRTSSFSDIESLYKNSRSEGFGEEVKRRIMLGTFVLSSGYYDAFYGKAQKARRVVRDSTIKDLSGLDGIIGPTTPNTAFPLGQDYADPTVLYLEDMFTVQAPLSGIPAISIPIGTHSNGMPYGMQVMGSSFDEQSIFQIAKIIESLP